jgi:hypothetical protein
MKTREELEEALLETLRQRQAEWIRASDDERDEARQRFMAALKAFNSLVLYYKIPDADGEPAKYHAEDAAESEAAITDRSFSTNTAWMKGFLIKGKRFLP